MCDSGVFTRITLPGTEGLTDKEMPVPIESGKRCDLQSD